VRNLREVHVLPFVLDRGLLRSRHGLLWFGVCLWFAWFGLGLVWVWGGVVVGRGGQVDPATCSDLPR